MTEDRFYEEIKKIGIDLSEIHKKQYKKNK